MDQRLSAQFAAAMHAVHAASRARPNREETTVTAAMQSIAELATADAAVLGVRAASDANHRTDSVAWYGLRPDSTGARILDVLGSVPTKRPAVNADGIRHMVLRPRGQFAAQLHSIFDFSVEVSVQCFPPALHSPAGGTWLLTQGARAPLEETRTELVAALADLLAVTLASPNTTGVRQQSEPRQLSSPLAGPASDPVARPAALLDTLDLAVMLIGCDGRIQVVSERAALLLGTSPNQIVGVHIDSRQLGIKHLDGRSVVADSGLLTVAIERMKPTRRVLLRAHLADGTSVGLRGQARPIFHEDERRSVGAALFLHPLTNGAAPLDARNRLTAFGPVFENLAPTPTPTFDTSTTRTAPSDLARLTNRERQVVQLLASGLRVANIAEELFLSEHTVRNHLKGIFRKLGVNNQADLVRRLRGSPPDSPDATESS
jgi:DNA-binding CsgD family transcriptional regulator/PAS domain-containing protein